MDSVRLARPYDITAHHRAAKIEYEALPAAERQMYEDVAKGIMAHIRMQKARDAPAELQGEVSRTLGSLLLDRHWETF